MEEQAVLSGDNAFNAHFGECIAAIGDIDDDGYQGQTSRFLTLRPASARCFKIKSGCVTARQKHSPAI